MIGNLCTRKVLVEKHNPQFVIKRRDGENEIDKVRRFSDKTYFHLGWLNFPNASYTIVKFDENLIDVHIKKGINDEEIIICKINQILVSDTRELIGIDGVEIENIIKRQFKLFRPVPILIEPQRKVVDLDD